MPVAGGGFEQCYNAQAVVDTETMLVVVAQVVQAANDKQQVVPMLERLAERPEDLSAPAAAAGRYRLLQRGQRRGLRGRRDRAAHRPRAR